MNGKRKGGIWCGGMYTREKGGERNTYIYSRGVGGGGLRNKIQEQKITTSRAAIKRWGREFSQATFIGKQKKNITKNGPGYVANLFKP